jgi:ABC-2 type transport system permease protein
MTTTTVTSSLTPAVGVSQRRVLASEWTKFRSVRSTVWTLLVGLVLMLGLAALVTALQGSRYHSFTPADKAMFTPIGSSLSGVLFAQLAIGVLGVLFVTGEYSTGMIRATLSAVPKRVPVWLAKISVFAVVTFVITLAAAFVAFFGGQAALSGYQFQGAIFHGPGGSIDVISGPGSGGALHSLGVSISHPGSLRAIFGAALFMLGVGLLGLGCGFIIRNTGGAIAALFGLLLVLPLLAQALPSSLQQHVSKFLPLLAGTAGMNTANPGTDQLAPWAGLGVFAIYVVVALGIGLVVLRRRDA